MKHKYRGTSWQWEFVMGWATPLSVSRSIVPVTMTDRTVLYSLDRTVHHGFRIAQSNLSCHALSSMAAQPSLNVRDPTGD